MHTLNSVDVGAVLRRVANVRFQAEERARSSDLTSVLAINRRLDGQASKDQLLTSIAEEAARLLKVDNVGFRLREGDDLVVAGVVGTASQTMLRPRVRIGESASGRVVAERRPVLADIGHDTTIDELTREALQRLGYTHYLGVPLETGGEAIGMLGFVARRPFGARDVEVAQAFASQAAVAIGHARLSQEASRREERVRALADLGRLLSETLDPETVGQRIVDSLCALLAATNAGLYRLPAGATTLALTARTGSVTAWERRLSLDDGVVALALHERRPRASADVCADPDVVLSPRIRERMWALTTRAVLAAPLLVGEQVLGALVVGDDTGRAWNDEAVFCFEPALEREILTMPPHPVGAGLSGEAFVSCAPVYVHDVHGDARSLLQVICHRFDIHGAALVPLRAGDRVVGILSIGIGERRTFSDEDKQLMGLLADQAAIAISNKRGEEELRALASGARDIMASIPSILVVVDGHDRITHWNAAAETRLGLPGGRVLGRPLAEAGIDWDWSTVGSGIARCRSTRSPVQLHDVRVRRAGQAGFLSITITPIESATGRRDLLIVADAVADGSVS